MMTRIACALVHVHVTVAAHRCILCALRHCTLRRVLFDELVGAHTIGVAIGAGASISIDTNARCVIAEMCTMSRVVAAGGVKARRIVGAWIASTFIHVVFTIGACPSLCTRTVALVLSNRH